MKGVFVKRRCTKGVTSSKMVQYIKRLGVGPQGRACPYETLSNIPPFCGICITFIVKDRYPCRWRWWLCFKILVFGAVPNTTHKILCRPWLFVVYQLSLSCGSYTVHWTLPRENKLNYSLVTLYITMFFLWVLQFPPLLQNQHLQIPIWPGIWKTKKDHLVDVLQLTH